MVASRQSGWGEHLPGNGIEFLAKGFLEVNSQALNGTMAGSPYYTPRPQLCGSPKWPQYQGKILSAMDFFFFFFFLFFCTLSLSRVWTSRGLRCHPFSSPVLASSIFIAHRVQQSHCSSIVHRVLLTHALALSASQFVHKKKSQRIYTSMHSAGLELTKLTYTRLEDNLIRHRGDRSILRCERTHDKYA